MASRKLEERLDHLRQLKGATADPSVVSILRKSLTDRSNLIVTEAAKVTAHLNIVSLIPDLLSAFDRLFEDPVKTDPKCWGKMAIVTALTQLDYSESAPFLRGCRHVQMEPVWGGQEDAAAQLRASCYLALVQCNDLTRFEVFRHLVDALADTADPVRIEGVRALGQLAGDDSILLLRLKARAGDRRPLITGHVFDALLSLERDPAVSFVGDYLRSNDHEIRDEAALALGASRLEAAINLLIKEWNESSGREFRAVLLRALSSSRQQRAIGFLLNLVKSAPQHDVAAALEALKLHENSPEIQALIDEAKRRF